MNELYAEAGVKVKPPLKFTLLKIALIVGIVLALGLSMLVRNPILGPIAAALVVVAIFFMPRLSNVEYEYIFCDGEISFDRIVGGASRKTMLKIDMDNVEVICAPDKRTQYEGQAVSSVKDFSKRKANAYMILISRESGKQKIYFDPSDKMVQCMYYKSPSKVKK